MVSNAPKAELAEGLEPVAFLTHVKARSPQVSMASRNWSQKFMKDV
jgi:hypothetical protein